MIIKKDLQNWSLQKEAIGMFFEDDDGFRFFASRDIGEELLASEIHGSIFTVTKKVTVTKENDMHEYALQGFVQHYDVEIRLWPKTARENILLILSRVCKKLKFSAFTDEMGTEDPSAWYFIDDTGSIFAAYCDPEEDETFRVYAQVDC